MFRAEMYDFKAQTWLTLGDDTPERDSALADCQSHEHQRLQWIGGASGDPVSALGKRGIYLVTSAAFREEITEGD